MNETIIFEHEETGGGCTAFIYHWGKNRKYEILLTDGDLSAPKSITDFPISISYFIDGYFEDGLDVNSNEELIDFISKVLERKISNIALVQEY